MILGMYFLKSAWLLMQRLVDVGVPAAEVTIMLLEWAALWLVVGLIWQLLSTPFQKRTRYVQLRDTMCISGKLLALDSVYSPVAR